jgi:hypothetical protein
VDFAAGQFACRYPPLTPKSRGIEQHLACPTVHVVHPHNITHQAHARSLFVRGHKERAFESHAKRMSVIGVHQQGFGQLA